MVLAAIYNFYEGAESDYCFPSSGGQRLFKMLSPEGEAFAEKLQCAGVDVTAVRIQGTIHDFVMLNALDQTNACRTAMDISTGWINRPERNPIISF